ncbi:MAG TPA: 2Fe-2S iron-sulfur cluster binding domain-containing protein [Clostridiales bacterium]|nr:2Fe-2S iron-sulfur cluster binding domain-containing protein [Clostridiales bacterium]
MSMIELTIDNKRIKVDKDSTILEAARQAGITVPTLCYLEGVHQVGSCRVCVVEVKGSKNLVPSCITKVQNGMKVITNSERVRNARRTMVNLLLSNHPDDCLACAKNQKCELQQLAYQLNIRENPFEGQPSRAVYDDSSPAIIRDSSKCILCRRCLTVCNSVQKVSVLAPLGRGYDTVISPAYGQTVMEATCVQCGQCTTVCPTGALVEKSYIEDVWNALADPSKHVVVQIAPAIRASIGECFGYEPGTVLTGKLVGAVKALGFDKVFDTNFTADLTIMEEGSELLHRISSGGKLPMITSCSPGWINFVEQFYGDILDHVSTCKSPQQMFGSVIKTYYAQKMGIDPANIYSVSVMPCTAKKYEARREEMQSSGFWDVDAVLTTRELAAMINEAGIQMDKIDEQNFDIPFGEGSGAGAIFGNTGGVMEAALRTVYKLVTGEELENVELTDVRGLKGIKEATIRLGGRDVSVAVVHGLGNIREILDQIREGKSPYTFIEIMCCPGGCIGGGGQPTPTNHETRKKRIEGLYKADRNLEIRRSHQNPYVKMIYEEFLGAPLGELSHKLLHTHYRDRRTVQ